jgi:hypothetical protein
MEAPVNQIIRYLRYLALVGTVLSLAFLLGIKAGLFHERSNELFGCPDAFPGKRSTDSAISETAVILFKQFQDAFLEH